LNNFKRFTEAANYGAFFITHLIYCKDKIKINKHEQYHLKTVGCQWRCGVMDRDDGLFLAELLKNSPEIVFENIAQILNNVAETGEKTIELSLGKLIPLPKPGKPKGPVKNLRPIILLSILRKILAIIVINRTFNIIRSEIKKHRQHIVPVEVRPNWFLRLGH